MEICNYELAKKLKEKGFREKCYAYWSGSDNYHTIHYNFIQNPAPSRKLTTKDFYKCENWYCERNNYDAPTISQVLKWLREKYSIHISTKPYPCEDGLMWLYEIRKFSEHIIAVVANKTGFTKEEQATLAGIDYCLDNLI